MEHQNWGESWIVPKNQKSTNKELQKDALKSNNVQGVTKAVSNKTYTAGSGMDGRQYYKALESEDTHVETVSHDIKIAIQKARQTKGWNQKQLANECGIKPDIIRDYENGKAVPDNNIIAKIERVTGVKLPRAGKK